MAEVSQLAYLSPTPGIGGKLKSVPEDFAVEEIMPDGTVLQLDTPVSKPDVEGQFVHFVLQKRDWATSGAIHELARAMHTGPVRFSTAGNKDKVAVTAQLVSAFNVPKERILAFSTRDMKVNGAWMAPDKVNMGQLLGNRFTIRVSGSTAPDTKTTEKTITRISSQLANKFPNYFGGQRFGSTRANTHVVGEKLIRGLYQDAAIHYLTDCEGEDNANAREARKELAATGDFRTALKTFPQYLRMERSMLAKLAERPNNYIAAFRALPRPILLLFIHAFQSHMFNELLSTRIKEANSANKPKSELNLAPESGEYLCSGNSYGFPDIDTKVDAGNKVVNGSSGASWLCMKLIGFETEPNEREQALLDKLGILPSDFKIRAIPEISSKGTYRTAFAPLKDFSFDAATSTFRFSLPSGSYATTALREFMEVDKK